MPYPYRLTLVLLLLMLPCSVQLYAQDWQQVLDKVSHYPNEIHEAEALKELVHADFKTDLQRAAAYYAWIGQHITYDCEAFHQPSKVEVLRYRNKAELDAQKKKLRDLQAKETLQKGSAICHGYTQLYQKLCSLSGIKCEVINGFSKSSEQDIGRLPGPSDHAWNAVYLNGNWQLVDVTWAAGAIVGDCSSFQPDFTTVYFCCPPDDFFLKHFPEDARWLLTDKNAADFAALPYFYSQYLELGMRITSPVRGIISNDGLSPIILNVESKTLPKEMGYAYDSFNFALRLQWQKTDNGYSAPIAPSEQESDILTLYHNGSAVVSYKVMR